MVQGRRRARRRGWNRWHRRRSHVHRHGCVACHTFSAIPAAKGKIGPSLDNLNEAAAAAGLPVEDFIRQSIVDPGAYVPPGYTAGTMPSFETQIPADKLDELVQYLAENTK